MHFGGNRNAGTARGTGWEARKRRGAKASARLVGALLAALSANGAALAQQSVQGSAWGGAASGGSASVWGSNAGPHGAGDVWESFTVDALFRRRPQLTPSFQTSAGSFLVQASAIGLLSYNANLHASPGAPRSDLYSSVTPEVRVASQWSRHSLEFIAGGEGRVYNTHDSDNQVNVFASLNGTIDIYHDLRAVAGARCAIEHEERGFGASFLPFVSPVERDLCHFETLVEKQFNRVWLNFGGSAGSDSYGGAALAGATGAAPAEQSYRSGNTYEIVGRAGYELTDSLSIFVESSNNWRDYENTSFSSDGYRLFGGLRFNVSELISAEFAGGRLYQEFNSAVRADIDSYAYRAHLTWRPDELVSVAALSERRLEEPSLFYGGSSVLLTEAGLEAGYAWRSDIQLSGAIGYGWIDYADSVQSDNLVRGRGSISYQIDRNVNLSVNYVHERYIGRPSELVTDYSRDSITVGLVARY